MYKFTHTDIQTDGRTDTGRDIVASVIKQIATKNTDSDHMDWRLYNLCNKLSIKCHALLSSEKKTLDNNHSVPVKPKQKFTIKNKDKQKTGISIS